jgi:hypothetical protein
MFVCVEREGERERERENNCFNSNYVLKAMITDFSRHINSMEQGPSLEGNRFSSSKEKARNLRNLEVHCRIHKSPSVIVI